MNITGTDWGCGYGFTDGDNYIMIEKGNGYISGDGYGSGDEYTCTHRYLNDSILFSIEELLY